MPPGTSFTVRPCQQFSEGGQSGGRRRPGNRRRRGRTADRPGASRTGGPPAWSGGGCGRRSDLLLLDVLEGGLAGPAREALRGLVEVGIHLEQVAGGAVADDEGEVALGGGHGVVRLLAR